LTKQNTGSVVAFVGNGNGPVVAGKDTSSSRSRTGPRGAERSSAAPSVAGGSGGSKDKDAEPVPGSNNITYIVQLERAPAPGSDGPSGAGGGSTPSPVLDAPEPVFIVTNLPVQASDDEIIEVDALGESGGIIHHEGGELLAEVGLTAVGRNRGSSTSEGPPSSNPSQSLPYDGYQNQEALESGLYAGTASARIPWHNETRRKSQSGSLASSGTAFYVRQMRVIAGGTGAEGSLVQGSEFHIYASGDASQPNSLSSARRSSNSQSASSRRPSAVVPAQSPGQETAPSHQS
jgi:hypothetical protein